MKKVSENERLAQHIYNSQMLKLQGKIMEKKLTKKDKNHFESQSQNISNNNSPVVGRQKSFENLQKANRTFVNLPVSQQKLSSILNVMAGQPAKRNQYSFTNELMDTVKIKMRKNQSMIQMEQQSPPLTKNASFHRPNSSVKNKLNSNSVSTEYTQIQRIKEKIKILLQERDKSLQQDAKEVQFMAKFNQTLNQLLVVLFSDHGSIAQQPSSTQDSFQTLQIDHFFKRQIQILQQSYQQQMEKKKIENILASIKKKHDQVLQENHNLQQLNKQQSESISQLKQQIKEFQKPDQDVQDAETQELKFLVQGQFEAIQKLLQREQLMKVFLKRVGDSSIIEMFEQFLQSAEYSNHEDTEGNLNINLLPNHKQPKLTPKSSQGQGTDKILERYEQSYKQVNLCDSLFADDSRVNDSEESSFGYMGKEQATEISCYFGQGQTLQQTNPVTLTSKIHKDLKEKLKINMMDVQLSQVAQRHESMKHQKNQKILPDDIIEDQDNFELDDVIIRLMQF